MKYKIVVSCYRYVLEQMVNDHIKEGWIPTGGVYIEECSTSGRYGQAMINMLHNQNENL